MNARWTASQVLELAPDTSSAKAGKGLALRSKWDALGQSERAVWGEIWGSGKRSYQVRVDISEPAFKCSCPSRKFPCKHALGLLIVYAESSDAFETGEPPGWVADWLGQRDAREEKRSARSAKPREVDPEAQTRRAAKREKKVQRGVEELSLWLADLVRLGLGAAQSQPMSYWDGMAARMVDAQASGLARSVRLLGEIASSGEGWQGHMLSAIGRLHLLLEAYGRMESLPEALREDVRANVGWTVPKEELLKLEATEDTWVVLGQRFQREEKLRVQQTWLWGVATHRRAMVLQFAAGNQGFESSFAVGAEFQGKLCFYPSARPLRAIVVERREDTAAKQMPGGVASIDDALLEHAQAVGEQPWIEAWPVRLDGVVPTLADEDGAPRWGLEDAQGRRLALDVRGPCGWQLLSIGGGRPLEVFGELAGDMLRPLSVTCGERFYACVQVEATPTLTRVA